MPHMKPKTPPPPKSREARLAEALKRNISRRKAAAKAEPNK